MEIICLSNTDDKAADPILLLATGLLSQEKRLQAVEQRLNEMSSRSTSAAATGSELGAKTQQSLEERQSFPLPTRMTYLEEDVEGNRQNTEHQLQTVHDIAKNNQLRESEDVVKLHRELTDYVGRLEMEINTTFARIENDINSLKGMVDANKVELKLNEDWYYHLNTGLFTTIDFVRHVEYLLDDRVYKLEQQMEKIMKLLREGNRMATESPTEPTTGTTTTEPTTGTTEPTTETSTSSAGPPTEPSVGGVGETGGGRVAKIMGDAEKALQEWIDSDPPSRKATSNAEEGAAVEGETARSRSSSLRELLYELNNYNM